MADPPSGRRRRARVAPEAEPEVPSGAAPLQDEAPAAAPVSARRRSRAARATAAADRARHYHVYVVYLRNPRGDGKAGYYVGMTGLSPDERLANHLSGVKAARIVRRHGVRLVPSLYQHLNPMTYEKALRMEGALAESLRRRGYQVFGGH